MSETSKTPNLAELQIRYVKTTDQILNDLPQLRSSPVSVVTCGPFLDSSEAFEAIGKDIAALEARHAEEMHKKDEHIEALEAHLAIARGESAGLRARMATMVCGRCLGTGGFWKIGLNKEAYKDTCPVCRPKAPTP